jgi:hypothetical protein
MRKKSAHQVVAEKRDWHCQPPAEAQAQGFKGSMKTRGVPELGKTYQKIMFMNPIVA